MDLIILRIQQYQQIISIVNRMVVIVNFTSPVTNSSNLSTNGVLVGTVVCPYNSTDGYNKLIEMRVPIGFSFTGNKYSTTPTIITFTMNIPCPTTCKVFKNGTLYSTISISQNDSNVTSKNFMVSSTGNFSINSFYYGLYIAFTPPIASANGDTYTFYVPFTYTLSSSANFQGQFASGGFSQNIIVNTTNQTSSFTNATYASAYTNSTGYVSYSQSNNFYYNANWSGTNTSGYIPSSSNSFNGLLQAEAYYGNTLWVTTSINIKQVNAATPVISFYDTDTLGASTNSLIYSSPISKVLSFDVTGTNTGFRFQGGSVQVESLNIKSSNSVINMYDSGGAINGTFFSSGNYFTINAQGTNNLGIKLGGGPVIVGTGYKGRQGQSGATNGNTMNTWWSGGVLQAWVDTTNVGNFTLCDYRIKENIQPASCVLDRLCNVNMFNYEMKDIGIFQKNGNHIGFYAHELKDAFPELNNIVNGEKDAVNENDDIQPQTITAEFTHLLMKSIQELNLKIIHLTNRVFELENRK